MIALTRSTILADARPSNRSGLMRVGATAEDEKKTSIYRGLVIGVVVVAGLWLFFRELRAA